MRLFLQLVLSILLLTSATSVAWSETLRDFTGLWQQDNVRSEPKRTGDVLLRIKHRDPDLIVETTISRKSASPRHSVQKYTTDGKIAITTGVDGDEFHTAVVCKGMNLVFTIEEHEDGRLLLSSETWSLLDDGATLERVRQRQGGETQILYYRRQQQEKP